MEQDFQVGVVIPTVMVERTGQQEVASVIIPTCDRPQFLRRSIASVAAAAYQAGLVREELEIIVVDDGDSDETARIVGEASSQYDYQIRCLLSPGGPRIGPATARACGISSARGRFIFLLDDDDRFLPNRFAQSLPRLRRGDADIVFENSLRVYEDDSSQAPFLTGPYASDLAPFFFLLAGGPRSHVTPAATAFTKAVYLECGGYDPKMRHYGEDGELLLRLCLYGRVALLAGDPVCRISIHASNTSRSEAQDYWQPMFSLSKTYAEICKDKTRWSAERRFLKTVISGKFDFALTQVRLESHGYSERLRRGRKIVQYFPIGCLRGNNLKTILVWLLKKQI